MDEHAEERYELEQLAKDDADEARLTREEWARDHELSHGEFVMLESEGWSR